MTASRVGCPLHSLYDINIIIARALYCLFLLENRLSQKQSIKCQRSLEGARFGHLYIHLIID